MTKIASLIIVSIIIIFSFFIFRGEINEEILEVKNMEKVIFKTKDGVDIHGSYFKTGDNNAPAVILLHMMPATKESWYDMQEKMATAGFQSLAIDFRGHGESILKNGLEINYQNFNDKEQQEKIYDVEAAVKFFEEKGIPKGKISLVGASIGANLALQYQSENKEIKTSVLISPGLDYRGVTTEDKISKLSGEQSVLFASG
ncbi:alpha/beta fold hydrolase, partial [Candidatus Azambacteria bacterium]|nr:alpha/beta fold hydrolase [Candidatus Azambacteria bacterium]